MKTSGWRALIAFTAAVLALPAACTGWLFFGAPDPAPYLATIDSLPIPAAWEVVHTQTLRDPFMGSRADRYYLVDAEPQDVAPVLEEALQGAGLEIQERGATCRENGPGGPISCAVWAFRWLSIEQSRVEVLFASISPREPRADVGVNDQHRLIDTSNRVLVTVSVDEKNARSLWSSPTPLAPATTRQDTAGTERAKGCAWRGSCA